MKIVNLTMHNFRCFSDLSIDFDDHLTVVVGVNGSGKTAILDGLAAFLESISHCFMANDSPIFPEIKATDMGYADTQKTNLQLSLKDEIDAEFLLNCNFVKSRFQESALQIIDDNNYYQNLNLMYQYYMQPQASEALKKAWPIFVYYNSRRVLPDDIKVKYLQSSEISPLMAFDNAFQPTIDFSNALAWFATKDADEARKVRDKDPGYKMPELEAVRQAIVMALGDYESPRISNSELLVLKKDTKKAYSMSQLSDGFRTMLALIVDLSRRMAVANSHVAWNQS
jgi:predicted ATP-binding protein involved in virulence